MVSSLADVPLLFVSVTTMDPPVPWEFAIIGPKTVSARVSKRVVQWIRSRKTEGYIRDRPIQTMNAH